MATPRDGDPFLSCPHSDKCGGCPLISRAYPEQLEWKEAKVKGAFGRFSALLPLRVESVAPAVPNAAYRTRAKLMVAIGGRVGLYAKEGDHEVIDTPDCQVLRPALREVVAVLRRAIAEDERGKAAPLAPFGGPRGGALRAIDVREVKDGNSYRVFVTLVMQRELAPTNVALKKAAARLMETCKSIAGFAVSFHEGDSPQVLGSQPVPLAGVLSLPDEIGGVRHIATFGSFVQAHRGQAAAIHDAILAALPNKGAGGASPRVLDLYGGSGAIALSLANHGIHVTLVESFGPAASRVREAAALLGGTSRVTAIHGDVGVALGELATRAEKFDAVVMNPPRRGISPEVRELLLETSAPVLLYVSCDPETLARDLSHLAELGYRPLTAKPFDMIAETEEVETLVVLHREEPPAPEVLFEDDEVLVVSKSGHEASISTKSSSLATRVRTRFPEAMPLYRLEHGTSGVVVFVKRKASHNAWTAAVQGEETSATFIVAARGITHQKGTLRNHDKGGEGTRFRRVAVLSGHSVIEARSSSCVSLPLRKQLGAIGHPVLGDDHGHEPTNRFAEEKYTLDRTFVHLARIELSRPGTKEKLVWEAPLPGDLVTVISRMGGDSVLPKLAAGPTRLASPQAPRTEE